MYPTPSESWKPLDDLEFLPEDLAQDYAAAVQNYDAEIWAGCLALSRRALERTVRHLLTELKEPINQPLAPSLRLLGEKYPFNKPFMDLAENLKEGGNIGAHPDRLVEPSAELATVMLNVLEYLLEYFFLIPNMIEEAAGEASGRGW